MSKWLILLLLIVTIFPSMYLRAQDIPTLMQQGAALERSFRDQEALSKYSEVLEKDPANVTALCKVSQLYEQIFRGS
jgi:hypothetical protein